MSNGQGNPHSFFLFLIIIHSPATYRSSTFSHYHPIAKTEVPFKPFKSNFVGDGYKRSEPLSITYSVKSALICHSGDFETVAAGSHYTHGVGQQKQQLGSGSSRTSLAHTSCYLECLMPLKLTPLVLWWICKHSSHTGRKKVYIYRPPITSKWPSCSSNVEHVTSHLIH